MGVYSDSHALERDEYGNWNRDYLNLDVPIEELAMPRNDEEQKLFDERMNMEVDEELEEAYSSLPFHKRGEDTLKNFLENHDIPIEKEEVIINESVWY